MQKNNTQVSATTPMDLAVNNNFIDQLTAQLTEKQKYGLSFPDNYNFTNALNSAYLILQDVTVKKKKGNDWIEERALDICSKQSIASSLMDMAVQALNPMKKQCYFVPFAGKLTLMRSYQGTMAVAKRVGAKDIRAEVIYEGDVFKYHIENGYKVIDEHTQDFMNIDSDKIIGAYAVVEHPKINPYVEIMNIAQLKKAWSKSRNYKEGQGVHGEFADQMAKKTVINRACKNFINSSDDAYLLESFESTKDNDDHVDVVAENVAYDIQKNANAIDFEEVVEDPKPAPDINSIDNSESNDNEPEQEKESAEQPDWMR